MRSVILDYRVKYINFLFYSFNINIFRDHGKPLRERYRRTSRNTKSFNKTIRSNSYDLSYVEKPLLFFFFLSSRRQMLQ